MQALQRLRDRKKLAALYPETGELSRHNYPQHMRFFEAGLKHRERCMMAANRVGKTYGIGGYETVLHLTGDYPDWWGGFRFTRPITGWAAGDTSQTVRDIIQGKLLGPPGKFGTGLIPHDRLAGTVRKAHGVADAVETISVKHVSGGISRITLKSFDQGRESFQGTEQDLIWLDEEPPLSVYTECLMRTMTTNGRVLLTFTPLRGISEVVMSFLQGGVIMQGETANGKYVGTATWDDAPHLSVEERESLWASLPAHERDARSKGIPALGSGAIYQTPEEDIRIKNFPIPEFWPRIIGLDVGWNATAAVYGAWDRDGSGTLYITGEYLRGQAEPIIHASALKQWGADWVPVMIDPASMGASQVDGKQLFSLYREQGLNLHAADNAVDTGIARVGQGLATGKIKIFSSCSGLFGEYRLYRRDDHGKIVKANDHRLDALRYLVMGQNRARIRTDSRARSPTPNWSNT